MQRYNIINSLIKKYDYKTYLEVGTRYGVCFKEILLPRENKTCIDIKKEYSDLDLISSSDDFFKQNLKKFDLIFIDADHSYEQSYKDVLNSLQCLNEGGSIVMHDCNPPNEEMILMWWMGTVYKTILKLRIESNLSIFVVDTDCGCGIIRKDSNLLKTSKLDYIDNIYDFNIFIKNPKTYLNLISVEDFKKLIET